MLDKSSLRQHMRERLRTLDPAFTASASRQIAAHILQHLAGSTPPGVKQHIALFGGLSNEPDLVPYLLPELKARGISTSFFLIKDHALQPRQVHTLADLHRGPMNVWEPGLHGPLVDVAALDIILVPGLAFTRDGARIGRGGGYYDRLLARPDCRARRLAIGFDCQVIDRLPVEAHDQRVHEIITESGVITVTGGQTSLSAA